MVPIIWYMRLSFKIDIKSLLLALLTSLVFIVYLKYYFLGTKLGTASLGGAFVTTLVPIITFVMLVFLGSKKVERKDIFALFLGAVGVLTILDIWNTPFEMLFNQANIYFVVAAFGWSILTILSSKSTKVSPIIFTFYLYVITVILDVLFLVDVSTIHVQNFDNTFWINIFVITIIASTFSNTIYFLGVEKLGTAEVSSFIFLVPFSAIGLSVIFLDEAFSYSMIFGTFLTIVAVKILNNIRFKKVDKKRS
jgi:drug/metabolite transporter (DMT)-like permease